MKYINSRRNEKNNKTLKFDLIAQKFKLYFHTFLYFKKSFNYFSSEVIKKHPKEVFN